MYEADYDDEAIAAPNFFTTLPGAFAYPFCANGIIILIVGTIFFGILNLLSLALGDLIALFASGYFWAYMFDILRSNARGEDRIPTWPTFSDFKENIVTPFILFIATAFVSLLPALIAAWKVFPEGEPTTRVWIFLALGMFYFPMALAAVAVQESFTGLNPLLVLYSIIRVPLEYLAACILFFIIVGINLALYYLIANKIPFLAEFLMGGISLYLGIVEMRILGLLYHCKKEKLNWV